GVGDLILTCNSSESRNFKFGKMVAECKSAKKALLMNKDTIEGVYTIKVIYEISKHDSIDMPIINSLYQLIYEDRNLFETINDIMKRPLKNEDI
ncbi:MAG: NAD(P)-dependent glycerol-3-phosphate dehydrogenase, partial [bacterium]|nr:NAD(P)-dependent glycerol-3-phosphate dehydrogenase [bacterium]